MESYYTKLGEREYLLVKLGEVISLPMEWTLTNVFSGITWAGMITFQKIEIKEERGRYEQREIENNSTRVGGLYYKQDWEIYRGRREREVMWGSRCGIL